VSPTARYNPRLHADETLHRFSSSGPHHRTCLVQPAYRVSRVSRILLDAQRKLVAMMSVLSYIIILAVFWVVAPMLGLALSLPFVTIARRFHSFAIALNFLSSAAAGTLCVLLSFWILHRLSVQPVWLMFLLPLWLQDRNARKRLARARSGMTPVAQAAGESYDADFQVKLEWGYRIGDYVGIVAPLAVRALPFV